MYTLTESLSLVRERQVSSVELTQACLSNIDRLNPALNAFITVTADLAMQQARQADEEIAKGNWRGPLHGIPIAIKDLIDLAGVPTTAASRQFAHRVPPQDAWLVQRLKTAGAVILGKTNLHEFAFGGSGLISAYGPVRNPWNIARISGGSSSGSAAAVASGMCVAAIGTDTAGSIRTPAALCGVVGHRPSANVWSTEGVIPLRPSFDTVGPLARTVEDAWIVLCTLLGDGHVLPLDAGVQGMRLGFPRKRFFDGLEPGAAECTEHALRLIGSLVAETHDVELEVDIPWTDFNEEILEFHRGMMQTTPELYQPDTLQRLRACATVSGSAYQQARAALTAARQQAEKLFREVDLLVTPTCLVEAPPVAELQSLSDLRRYEVEKLLVNTAPFSLLFWPSLSVPCGFTGEGLPVGLQISAAPGRDQSAFHLARAYEQATEWHKRLPLLSR
jgi:Asp-tRNA(Asn)/Glu-tRNA(Gln) amidotransferase A subunit family amidase